jgi:hypothetical protein
MLRGNGETALGIERELIHAAKEGGRARWIDASISLPHPDAPAGSNDSEVIVSTYARGLH